MARNSYLKFDTAVSDHFGSNNTAIAFARLIYWFGKKPDGFYKFKEACKHPLYKAGDSWSEDLKMTKRILDPILKRLITHHISKNSYRESKDKFAGKMFCSYTERNTNRTFYFMDRDAVDQFLSSLNLTPPLPSPNVKSKPMEVDVVSSRPKNMPLETSRTAQDVVPLTCARLTAFNTHTITSLSGSAQTEVGDDEREKEKLSSKKMIELWNSHAQDKVIWYPSTASRLYKVLSDFFGGCLETFRNYCAGIASSQFLMGKAPNSNFKAIFYWAIKPEVIKSIFQGAYGVEGILRTGDKAIKANPTSLVRQSDLQEEIFASAETQEIKDFRALCLETIGNAKYISLFKNLNIEFREGGEIALIAAHKFGADWLELNCSSYLQSILQRSGEKSERIIILAPGETKHRIVERDWKTIRAVPTASMLEDVLPEELSEELDPIEKAIESFMSVFKPKEKVYGI